MKFEIKTLDDVLRSLYPDCTPEELAQKKRDADTSCKWFCMGVCVGLALCTVGFNILLLTLDNLPKIQVPEIKIVAMNFVAELDNSNNATQQSHYLLPANARWDLLIRVPGKLVGNYICLQGNLQASFLYKNVTLVTSSIQSYNTLELGEPQLLNISAVAAQKDLNGAIGKEIIDAIKKRNEVRFGSRLFLTDCREETKKGTMSYECDEAKLQFEAGSKIKATTFQSLHTCTINL